MHTRVNKTKIKKAYERVIKKLATMHHWNPTNLNLFFVNNCGEGCTIEFTKEIDFIQVCIDMELNGNFWWTVSLVGKQESKKRKKKK